MSTLRSAAAGWAAYLALIMPRADMQPAGWFAVAVAACAGISVFAACWRGRLS